MIKNTFKIKNNINEEIFFDVRYKENLINAPAFIFFHGFKGFRNWGFIPYICEQIANNGLIAINIDFSLNGIIDDKKQIYDEEKFSNNTLSQELTDAKYLINEIFQNVDKFKIENHFNGKLILAGHSLGGAVSIFMANKFRDKVSKLVLLASIADLDRNTQRQKEYWKNKGYTTVKIKQTAQELKLKYDYLKDKEENFLEDAILHSFKHLEIPKLVLYAENDLVVNKNESVKFKSNSFICDRFVKIENTGHTFGVNHPMVEPTKAVIKIVNEILSFIK